MKYYVLHLSLVYSFVAVCTAKEIEIGAVVQLDKYAIKKIAAILQNPADNDNDSKKRYVDYLIEAITVIKSYDKDALSDLFDMVGDEIKSIFEMKNVTNSKILKDLDKIKHETKDKLRRKLLGDTLSALEEKSDAGARRQNLIEEIAKDFKTNDIASFITYLKLWKHDIKRTDTKSHSFKKVMSRIVKATMVILNCLRQERAKNKQQNMTKKYHTPNKPEKSSFEDNFEYVNQDEGLKTKLDHDYFAMDRPWDELADGINKKHLRKRPTLPLVSYIDETGTFVPSRNEDSSETVFDDTPSPKLKHTHRKKDVLADLNIVVKKTKNRASVKNHRGISDHQKYIDDEKASSELLRQLFPPKTKSINVKILKEGNGKPYHHKDGVVEKPAPELSREKGQNPKGVEDKKTSEFIRQLFPPQIKKKNVKVLKHQKADKIDADDDKSSEWVRGKAQKQNVADYEKTSLEFIRGRDKKHQLVNIEESLELHREKAKKHKADKETMELRREKAKRKKIPDNQKLSDLVGGSKAKNKNKSENNKSKKVKKQNNAEFQKTSSELLRQLLPPELKNINVTILKQDNGIPQEIHFEHDAMIHVRNFNQYRKHRTTHLT